MYTPDVPEYAALRLQETIIRYNNRAAHVDMVRYRDDDGEYLQVEATDLLSGTPISDHIDNFDLTPVKLGFVNLKRYMDGATGYVAYTERKPMRQDWRQGLRRNNTVTSWGVQGAWDFKDLAKTINGEFPTVAEAMADVPPFDNMYMAWHRDFCVNGMGHIFYRWYGKVGEFTDREGVEFVLDEKFYWIEESLKEAL